MWAQRLTVVLVLVSLVLRVITNYYYIEACEERVEGAPKTDTNTAEAPPADDRRTEDAIKWLKANMPSSLISLEDSCPVPSSTAVPPLGGSSVIVVGEINLNITKSQDYRLAVGGLDLGQFDIMMSGLSSVLNSDAAALVRSLNSLGLSLVSLSNRHMLEGGEAAVADTVHILESSHIKWVGLHAKSHLILTIGGMKVGVLGFCGIYGHCGDSSPHPFTPVKYSFSTGKESVEELKQHGADIIIVSVYWGNEHGVFPDEMMLYIARHLSNLPHVSAIIGHHPKLVQGHAYFGETLVIFSPGVFLSPDNDKGFCWRRLSKDQWRFKDVCGSVHPASRHTVLDRELQSRVYKLYLRKSMPVVAQYKTLSLDVDHSTGLRHPMTSSQHSMTSSSSQWTTVCSSTDPHCLSCHPL